MSRFASALWTAAIALALVLASALGCEDAPEDARTASASVTPPTAEPSPTAVEPTAARTPTPAPPNAIPPSPTAAPVPTGTPTLTPAPTPSTAAPSPIPPTPFPTPDPRARGGSLSLSSEYAIAHLDVHADVSPALAAWGPGVAYSRLMRLRTGEDAPPPSLAVECDLCARWEMESPTSFRFEMREDARWHPIAPADGRRVSARDVAYSYARQSDPSSPNAPLLGNVADVRALDDLTLRA